MQLQILPSRAALVDRIALQFEYGQNLIVLLGTSGLGKSYILETFVTDKYDDFNKSFVQVNAKTTDSQLMGELLEQSFNAPLVDHNLSLSENFYQLSQIQPCGPCLWVLDGGRHLSDEFLIELELLSKNSPSTLYIILASPSKLHFNNAVEIYLEPLNLYESKQLMSWYFTNLPYDEDPVFQTFLTEAHGNPSLLLAWEANKYTAEVVVKDKVSWRLHLLILLLMVMFLIVGFLYKSNMTHWWQQYYNQKNTEVSTTAISVEQVSKPLLKQNKDTSTVSIEPSIVKNKSVIEEMSHHNDVPAIMQSLVDSNEKVKAAPVIKEVIEAAPTPVLDTKVANKANKEQAQFKSENKDTQAWYAQQPQDNIVIQLLAVTQKAVGDEFIAQYKLQKIVHTYQTKRNNKTWWVITFGSYANLNDAKLAMKSLPVGILKNKPFYKKISKIKQEITLLNQ